MPPLCTAGYLPAMPHAIPSPVLLAVLLPCVDVAPSRLPVVGAKEPLLLVGVCGSCARSKAGHRNGLPRKRRPALRTPQRMALGGQATGLPAACPCGDDRARGVRDDDRAR